MYDQSQQGGSNFRPMVKVSNGGSKGILKAARKEYHKYQMSMKHSNLSHHNYNVIDQRANVAKKPKTNPLKNSNVGPSNAPIAKDSKSRCLQSSKDSRQPTTLSLNPSPTDLKCSKPSNVRNRLSPKEMETTTPSESNGDPNTSSRHLDQSHHLKPKGRSSDNMESSRPPHFKAMPSLVHKAKDVDLSNVSNDALGTRSKGRSNLYRGEDINVRKDGTKISKLVKKGEVSRISNIPMVSGLWIANKDDSNKKKGRHDEVMTKEKKMIGHTIEDRATFGNLHKQQDAARNNEASSSRSLAVGKKDVQGLESNFGDNSSHLVLGNGKTNDGKFRRRKGPLLEETPNTHGGIDSDGVIQQDQTCRPRKKLRLKEENEDKENSGGDRRSMVVEHDEGVRSVNLTSMMTMKQGRSTETNGDKVDGGCQNFVGVENGCEGAEQLGIHKSKKKRRRCIETNKYEDDMCDQHRVRVEDDTNELAQVAVSMRCVEQQCYCCSKPIDKPKMSVLFKIDGKEYISLAGHLSTKSCEKVWKLSLPMVVEVTKVPRLAAWPKMWKASQPTGDSIGLYFFPHKLRHDEELDRLIKELMDEDLALCAVIDEAEMLIFPSVLLPERHQTFQAKHYLWAAFKAKQDKCTVSVQQEEDKKKQQVSSQLDEVQSEESDQEMILMNGTKPLESLQLPAKSIREVETCCIQGTTNMHLEREVPEESRPRDSLHQAFRTSASTAVATDAATIVANAAMGPTEATSSATNTASCSANHGPTNPSTEALPGSSSVFGIVLLQTPDLDRKVQQFIQEMKRDGVPVAVMQGEAIGAGQWPSNITTAKQ
ncbi:unnamed protein product [Urochloa decumbens]|uniref:AIPP2-like SPOC-like domain-containing protein n=1 Tax=Urochloa decumbens TaxID=240449 RepID=A0ABC8W7B4_9POAL